MDKIFVDTDILIDFTYKKNEILYDLLVLQKQKSIELHVNPVVIAEFFTDQKLKRKTEIEKAYKLVSFFSVLDINAKTGMLAGQFLRDNKINSMSDALIAATCVINPLLLATRNRKHFKKIPQLKFYEIESTN